MSLAYASVKMNGKRKFLWILFFSTIHKLETYLKNMYDFYLTIICPQYDNNISLKKIRIFLAQITQWFIYI